MITDLKDTSCDCPTCKKMCDRPCWPSPSEASKLIENGYGNKLMLDYWVAEPKIWLICPAIPGFEGKQAPEWPTGGCVFQDVNGLCLLHDKGLKPIEGRLPDHNTIIPDIHHKVAKLWDNNEGITIVMRWKQDEII